MKYKMQLSTTTGALPWEYDFTMMGSVEMAIEFAQRHTKQFKYVPWFMHLILWQESEPEDWKMIGTFIIVEDPIIAFQPGSAI